MVAQKRFIFFIGVLLSVGAALFAKSEPRQARCGAEPTCLKAPNCQCYCSEKGDFRDKKNNDKPVYIDNDSNGVHCYCKQWDLDKYPGPARRDQ